MKAAADNDYTPALNDLAIYYARGTGTKKNEAKAYELYNYAAGLGDSAAMYNVGYVLLKGQGVKQDPTRAIKWLELSAQNHVPCAALDLGVVYTEGKYVKQDTAAAKEWFRNAIKYATNSETFTLNLPLPHDSSKIGPVADQFAEFMVNKTLNASTPSTTSDAQKLMQDIAKEFSDKCWQ